jgi:hypothetical protein
VPFTILAALSLTAAAPVPSHADAVKCAATYAIAATLKVGGSDGLAKIGTQWLVHAARSAPKAGVSEGEVAREGRDIVRAMLGAGGMRGWSEAIGVPVSRCERLQAGLPPALRSDIEAAQARMAQAASARGS